MSMGLPYTVRLKVKWLQNIFSFLLLACMHTHILYMCNPRQLIFLGKSDFLGCAVLLCLVVCLNLLASSFRLISH